jgi:hypothetical protein
LVHRTITAASAGKTRRWSAVTRQRSSSRQQRKNAATENRWGRTSRPVATPAADTTQAVMAGQNEAVSRQARRNSSQGTIAPMNAASRTGPQAPDTRSSAANSASAPHSCRMGGTPGAV